MQAGRQFLNPIILSPVIPPILINRISSINSNYIRLIPLIGFSSLTLFEIAALISDQCVWIKLGAAWLRPIIVCIC